MKKLLSVLLCMPMIASLAACNNTSNPTSSTSTPASSSEPAPPSQPVSQPSSEPVSSAPVSEAPSETEMESITYKDVTIYYPAGMEVLNDGESAGVLLELNMAALMVQENNYISAEEYDAMFETGEAWDATAQMVATSMGGELLENSEVGFAGGRAGYLRMANQLDGTDATAEVYIFSAGGTLYMLMALLTDEGEEKYGDIVRLMLDSVEVDW
ncbi:hypothetical protein LJC49_09500 [Ruminococcaceae bacterium OttesenSCG-928-I18]|nr:hypothetical protein [Ruminococcaceae bacterium OttesenSCG-928-I18]